ncbi:DUF4855 domain-containing protein [Paenibacillus sp. FSL K6-3182]|uniref:DUF4855 domain-containing protein n=1 Tax=Paenibacillus sp. FSL K6-3182 TaxID=2921495 RepID=UPI0030D38782
MERSDSGAFLRSGEQTAGINNLMLFYNGHYKNDAGVWRKEQFIPYISYIDAEGKPLEWLFDGALFLAKWSHSSNGFEESEEHPNDEKDWKWYLEKTFAESGELSALNEAMEEVAVKLADPEHKMKVVLMIPYPAPNQQNFGAISDDNNSLCFDHTIVSAVEATRNKQKALEWYIGQLLERWERADLPFLELKALYWMNEAVNTSVPYEEGLIGWTGDMVRAKGLKFFWIPYYRASLYWKWKELGFDAAAMQPNHFFTKTGESRVGIAANMAKQAGMGVEIEVDSRVFESDGDFRAKYENYLAGGARYGYSGEVFKGYYQDVKLLFDAAYAEEPEKRDIYDLTYQFIKGRYKR